MSHQRHYTLVPEEAFAPGQVDRVARLQRFLGRSHHHMGEGAADRLAAACLAAVPDLFQGARVARSEIAVRALVFGRAPAARGLQVPLTGDIPRATWGADLAEVQLVLRALRPSRVPRAGPDLVPHLSGLRVLLRYVVPDRLRLVTWVAA